MGSGMSEGELIFRPYAPGDERAINDAFNEVFGLERPLDEWLWKYPPEPGGRPIMLALQDDELLAVYGGLPARLQVDGRTWSAVQIVDVLSTPAARRRLARRGVWVRTVEEFFQVFGESGRYPLLYGFPGRRALRLGVLQLGYDALEPQTIGYLRRARGAARSDLGRLLYRAELARDWEPRLDVLWRRVRPWYPVAMVRDAERSTRRLAGRPRVRYHRFLVTPRISDQPVAFAAFRTDGKRCQWVDLVWDHGHPGALALLSRLGARLAEQTAIEGEEMWLNGDPAAVARLESLGFTCCDEPNGLVLVARSFSPSLDVTSFDGRIYLTMADADLV